MSDKFPPRVWIARSDDESQLFPNPGMAKLYGPWDETFCFMSVDEHLSIREEDKRRIESLETSLRIISQLDLVRCEPQMCWTHQAIAREALNPTEKDG